MCQGRLSLHQEGSLDSTGSDFLYLLPFNGNRIGLWTGSDWEQEVIINIGLPLAGTVAGKNYDVYLRRNDPTPSATDTTLDTITFASDPGWHLGTEIYVLTSIGGLTEFEAYYARPVGGNAFTLHDSLSDAKNNLSRINLTAAINVPVIGMSLSLTAWGNDVLQSPAPALKDAILIKSGDPSYRYLGSLRTYDAGMSRSREYSRLLSNHYNRLPLRLEALPDEASHNYTQEAWRVWNNDAALGKATVEVVGVGAEFNLRAHAALYNASLSWAFCGIGWGNGLFPITEAHHAGVRGGFGCQTSAELRGHVGGYAYFQLMQWSRAAGTTTWYGKSTLTGSPHGATVQSGLQGVIWG